MNSGVWQYGWPTSLFLPLYGAHTKHTKFSGHPASAWYQATSAWYQMFRSSDTRPQNWLWPICLSGFCRWEAYWYVTSSAVRKHSEQKKRKRRVNFTSESVFICILNMPVNVCFFLSKWVRRVKWVIEARKGILLCIIKCFPLEIQHSFQYWV